MNKWLKLVASAGIVSTLAACGGNSDSAPGNIVQVAQSDGFTALTAAVTKAGLTSRSAATLQA